MAMPLVIMLAGHGSVNATQPSINAQGHEAFFAVTSGDMFCLRLSAHNMTTANFAVSVRQGIKNLVLNPTGGFVTSNLGSRSIRFYLQIQ